jgi:hypothetical protein
MQAYFATIFKNIRLNVRMASFLIATPIIITDPVYESHKKSHLMLMK